MKKNSDSYQRIIESAREKLSLYGLSNLNVRDIAKKAQLSIGSIYVYFRNKESILKKIIDHQIEQEFRKLEQHFDEMKQMELEPAIRSLVHFCYTTYRQRPFATNPVRIATLALNDFSVEKLYLKKFGTLILEFLKYKNLVDDPELAHKKAQYSSNLIISNILFHTTLEEKTFTDAHLEEFVSESLITFLQKNKV